jgi:hypothetical protein
MTWAEWMTARQYLWEEQIGKHLRTNDNAKSSEYAQSVAALRRAGLSEV